MLQCYTFIDFATQGYIALVGLLVLLFHGDAVHLWPAWVLAHGLSLGLIHCLIQTQQSHPSNRWLERLRAFYPIVLFPFLYGETGHLNQMFFTGYLDPFFFQLEEQLFGTQPSLLWMEKMPWLWISELFYLAYFSFYLMILGVGIILFCRNPAQFQHYLAVVAFIMYICFLCYLVLPVAGPNSFYRNKEWPSWPGQPLPLTALPPYPLAVKSGFFFQIMQIIYRWFELPGAAFPSSHVAVALATLYFSRLYLRRIWRAHAVMVALLCAATVYCRYHYVVDVLAGMMAAVVLLPLGDQFFKFFVALHARWRRVSSEIEQNNLQIAVRMEERGSQKK